MLTYRPPTKDSLFVLKELLPNSQGTGALSSMLGDDGLLETIVEEAGRFAAEVIAPLNAAGDRAGCTRQPNGSVSTPLGYADAFRQYRESGWGTLSLPEAHGGQGMPHVLATVVEEFFNSACHAFNMYPGLTHGAVSVLLDRGGEDLKSTYLSKLVSGECLGTMALTEPHAGTDLGLIRTRAERQSDSNFAVTGEKIFCSGGEHDLTENIVHLVMARIPGAPDGSRGISLFLVPKILPDGTPNSVSCGSIEHKMGIHGSATCVMNFEGATGWLIGGEHEGLSAMFIMMNAARLACGNQGLAQAELAYQNAVTYALDRRQGRGPGSTETADPLIVHPDVRRMLMDARAFTEGFRALVLWTAAQIDRSYCEDSEAQRAEADAIVSLLTPVIKAYGTDRGFETAVAMQQIFGGHGYVAEWGMEQIVRDARVAMLYEGANGVQALDLVGRKLLRDRGQVAERFFALVEGDCLRANEHLHTISEPLAEAVNETRDAAKWLLSAANNSSDVGAASYPFLQLMGVVAIGWMWLRSALVAQSKLSAGSTDTAFFDAKILTARHYADRVLPESTALRRKVLAGGQPMMTMPADAFNRA